MSKFTLPLGWSSKRLKHLATYNDEVLAESTGESTEIDYVEISGVSLSRGIEEIERMTFGQAPSRARRKVRSGDILISTVRPNLRAITKVTEASPGLVASTGFCVVRPNGDVDNGFLGWAAQSELFVSQVVARSVGVSYPAINSSDLVTIKVPLPPLDTQHQIVKFLDEKTACIDALIEKKRKLLKRLAEKRQALITRAVTKGLNPDASEPADEKVNVAEGGGGVNLLAQIPKSWVRTNVGHYCDVQLGKMLQSDPLSESDELKPYLRAINIGAKGQVDLNHQFSMWIRPQETERFRLKQEDILVSEGGDAGRTAIFDVDGEYYFQNAINRVRPGRNNKIIPALIYYWFTFLKISGYVEMICNVATIPHFTAEKVKASPLALPPLDTQHQIAKFLDEKTAEIDEVRMQILNSIELLYEYRSALITAAVTGQLPELV